ncbi:hypothetical protein GCM10027347_26030 [Larkinella harenae]
MAQPFTSFQEFKRRYPIQPGDPAALLGTGSYGRVIKVEDQLETEWVAIKISEFKGNDTKSLKAEVDLAKRVPRQANIARYDACYRLETDTSISDFAIMKYYPDGNLADLLKRAALTDNQLYGITRGILLGLQHLHRHRIVHRDFKPANILISRDNAGRFIPKIADFGLSKLVSDDELDSSDFDLSDGRGTPSYKAPEQIEGSRVSFNLDLWAFGIILYEMLTGEKPFRADARNVSEQSVRREIEKKIITVDLPDRLREIGEPYQSMIRRCLVRDIHQRVRKEDELLDLLDHIPKLLGEAKQLVDRQQYEQAILRYEQVLAKRENQAEAEQGINTCRAGIEQKHIQHLLTEAEGLIAYQQFEGAKNRYEQILQRNPTQEKAVRGLAFCIEQLRPKTVFVAPEVTDVFVSESTDIFAPLPVVAPVVLQPEPKPETVAPVRIVNRSIPQKEIRKTVLTPTAHPTSRRFPWRLVIPAAVLAGGVMGYILLKEPAPKTPIESKPVTEPVNFTPNRTGKKTLVLPIATPNAGSAKEEKSAIKKRVDTALAKARSAFARKDYETTLMLTNSALQLDPSRRDVRDLRTRAEKARLAKATVSTELVVNSPPVKPSPTEAIAKPEPIASAEENRHKKKKEQQDAYDQRIEQGMKAITGSNDKARAATVFASAQAMAKEHDLITAKADEAYSYTMNKGNGYFNREEFDGAKAWFLVAQSLKDTDEVRRKIKQCTH